MKLNEAVCRLEIFVRDASEVAPELLDNAIRLGIEALKREERNRKDPKCVIARELPGETPTDQPE